MGASGSSPRAAVEGTLEGEFRSRRGSRCPCPCLGALTPDGSLVAPRRAGWSGGRRPAFPPPGLLPRGGRGLEAVAAAGAEHHGRAVSVPREGRGQPRADPAPGHDAAGVGRHAAGHPRGPAVRSAARPRRRRRLPLSPVCSALCPESSQSHGLTVSTRKRPPLKPGRMGASAGSDLGGHEARALALEVGGWATGSSAFPSCPLAPPTRPPQPALPDAGEVPRGGWRDGGGEQQPLQPDSRAWRLVWSLTALARVRRCPSATWGPTFPRPASTHVATWV